MRTLAVDAKNDLYLGRDGSLAIATGIEAVLQAAQQAAQTQLGEMQYAIDEGIPNFTAVWGGAANVAQFEAYLRRTLLAVEGVRQIVSLTISTGANKLSYVVTLETDFGQGALNG